MIYAILQLGVCAAIGFGVGLYVATKAPKKPAPRCEKHKHFDGIFPATIERLERTLQAKPLTAKDAAQQTIELIERAKATK